MIANSTSPGIVVQAFAKSPLSVKQWDEHFSSIEKLIAESQSPAWSPATRQEAHVELLDSVTSDGSARIAQQIISTSTTPAFTTCQSICKSSAFAQFEVQSGIEHSIQPLELLNLHRDAPGLAVFDMDSTLIQQEVIDELARAVGLYAEVSAITEAAMRGEAPYTDFEASLRARVALLKGVPTSIWDELKTSTIKFTPGANDLVRALKALGWKTAVLSGGFTPLAEWVEDTLGLDYAHANHLVTDEAQGILTGELVSGKPIIHSENKREQLQDISIREHIPLARVIAVGDGSNDLLMMGVAGLGIAFNAKPKVQQAAPVRLNTTTLLDVMYVLGYSKQEVDELLSGNDRHKP